jgi:hypothetical protein
MTFDAGGPLARRQAAQARRGPGNRARLWFVAALAVVVLLAIAGNGGRAWWARNLGHVTNHSRAADFVIGLAIGLLPAIGVGIAGLSRRRRRALRMFVGGAVGFVVTDLLAPSVATAIRHDGGAATRPFDTHVPGYLAGVYTGIGLLVVVFVIAIVRARRRWHQHLRGYTHYR